MADNDTPDPVTHVPHETSSPGIEPKWWIDDKTPGVGDRPTFIPEKFKTVADLSTAYLNLEKKVGSAPVGEYDFGEYGEMFDKEHPALKELTSSFKEKRVPQEAFTKVLESVKKLSDTYTPDPNAEKAKLGEDADNRLKTLDNWAQANFSKESYKALTENMQTADSILAMEEVRNKMLKGTIVPNSGDNSSSESNLTLAEIQDEINTNYDKYKTDPKYRAEMKKKMAMVTKDSNFVDKTMR